MGRAGQFVRPCWLGVLVRHWWCGAGGEELVARLMVRLALARFFIFIRCAINFVSFCRHFWSILCPKLAQNGPKNQKKLKKKNSEKKAKKDEKRSLKV